MPRRDRQQHIVAEPGSELLTDHGEPLFVAQLVLAQPGAGKDKRQGLAILIQPLTVPQTNAPLPGVVKAASFGHLAAPAEFTFPWGSAGGFFERTGQYRGAMGARGPPDRTSRSRWRKCW